MDVRNCRKCGKLFSYISGQHICASCKEDLEKTFLEVKTYIRDNKKATLGEIAEACKVETTQLQQWIREERLEFTADSPIKIQCENCGMTIRSGRFCEKCKQSVANGLSTAISKPQQEAKPAPSQKKSDDHQKMRFLSK